MPELRIARLISFILFMSAHLAISAQEYTYDVNGNLKTDGNKQIASIHYNYMSLADTILYSDGRKMIYTYTATGQKLSEKSILTNGTIKQKRDYAGSVLYRNDSLREIKHEDGRVVPVTPGNNTTSWEYQYHLSDHLGNVRSTLTSKQGTETNTSTFESTNATAEQNKYLRYNVARKINAILFDHTHTATTHYSERLNGSANERYGIARSLSVMPGDIIKLEAYAKYIDPNQNNLTQALTTLLTQVASGTAPAGTVVDGAGYATNGNTPFVFAGLNNTSGSSGAGPKAYLNWLVFDRNFIFKNGGYVRMTTAAKENGSNVPHEKLFKELVIKEPGYVYMYLSNEETTPLEVYFDDVSVTQVNSPVIQQSDYDPFGLAFHDYAREDAVPNNFLYNGKELQRDFDLNWYDYGARMYDAALGRWHVIDPMAEKYPAWSPYAYALNSPCNNTDPDGREVKLGTEGTYITTPPPIVKDNQKRLIRTWRNLVSTPEGKHINNKTENNDNVVVYVAFVNHENITNRKTPAAGVTFSNKGWIPSPDDAGRTIIKGTEHSDGLLAPFSGLDVTVDVAAGREVHFIVIDDGPSNNEYQLAAILGHELEAHVNINSGNGFYDHLLYGDFHVPKIETTNPEGDTFITKIETSTSVDTPGSRLAKQLGSLATKRAFDERRAWREKQEIGRVKAQEIVKDAFKD